VVPAPHATSRRITEYLKGLIEHYQVVVLSVKTPDHSHIERYHGARLLRVPVGNGHLRSRMESFDRAVRRQLESEEYLLVHFFDPVSGYPLCELRGDYGYNLVYGAYRFPSSDLPSLMPGEGANKRMLARSRRQELFCLMNADAIVVGSEAARAHCVSLGVPQANISVVRTPIDLAPFSADVMGKPDGVPARLIHLGSHGRHQDLPILLEALAKTKTAVKLALVGPSSSELTPALKERAAELMLTERVEFQEPVVHDDLHKVLAAADIGVVTLTDEPRNRAMTPLARIGEFLAAGRPIIAADVPLTRELIPAAAARFYAPGSADSLAEAIDTLAGDVALRCSMAEAAKASTKEVDSKVVSNQLIAIYRRIAPGAAPPTDAHVDSDPRDTTQLGTPLPEELTQSARQSHESDSQKADVGTNKLKTDPAALAPVADAETGTDQSAARGRPPVMGVLLRDDSPSLLPEPTEPAVQLTREVPVVMGLPIEELSGVEAVNDAAIRPPLPALGVLLQDDSPPVPSQESALVSAPDAHLPEAHLPDAHLPDAHLPGAHLPGEVALEVSRPEVGGPATKEAEPLPQRATHEATPLVESSPAPDARPLVLDSPSGPKLVPTSGTDSVPATGPAFNASEDEPLDFAVMLKPSSVTATNVSSLNRPSPPIPFAVPTSFSLASNRTGGAPGSTLAAGQLSIGPSSQSGLRAGAMPVSSASGLKPSSPSQFGGQASSPSGERPPPLSAPLESSGSRTSGVRVTPAVSPPVASARQNATPVSELASPPTLVHVRAELLVPPASEASFPRLTTPALTAHDDLVEVNEDEVELINDESFLSVHDDDDEIQEGELHALETSAAPPPSRLDPWFAQLVHGYCPPESQLFTRHVPPTTMPGRDT
jgi:glycosyltransferase involved in cell wall biosynthesis